MIYGLISWQLLHAGERDLALSYRQNTTARNSLSFRSPRLVGWPIIEPHAEKIVAAVDQAEARMFVRVSRDVYAPR